MTTRMITSNTTTTAVDQRTATTTKSDIDPHLAKYHAAVAKIIEETGRSTQEAVAGLEFIERMAAKARTGARCNTVGTHHLTDTEMATTGYAVMDAIMGHGAKAEEGSAHAAVQAYILGPNEFALTHDNPTNRKEDCVVTVNVGFA